MDINQDLISKMQELRKLEEQLNSLADELLHELHSIAHDYNPYEFGLPLDLEVHQGMRDTVIQFLFKSLNIVQDGNHNQTQN